MRYLLLPVGCVGLAAATLLLPSTPTTDAWAWIVWGREVVGLDLDTDVGGSPAWKPLPVLATAPLSLFGDDAPALWLLTLRAIGFLGLLLAFNLAYALTVGTRHAGELALGGVVAGVLAVASVALSQGWLRTFLFGFSEPAAIACMLLALQRHLAGRHRQALVLGAFVALARPEALVLLGIYGSVLLVAWNRSLLDWVLVGTVLIAVPFLWLMPDWISTGDPFHSARATREAWGRGVHHLGTTLTITPAPLFVTAVAGAVVDLRRGNRRLAGVTAFAFAWIGLLLGARLAGYPASPRYFVVPETVLCVAGAAGMVVALQAPHDAWIRVALAGVAGASLWLALVPQVDFSRRLLRGSEARARGESDLATAIHQAGDERLSHCGTPRLPYGTGWIRGVVAWRLEVHTGDVHRVQLAHSHAFVARMAAGLDPPPGVRIARVRHQRKPAVLFLPIDGLPAREMGPRAVPMEPLTVFRAWKVFVTGGVCRIPAP